MMLFLLTTYYLLLLVRISSGVQCPSPKYCTCSLNLTVIECANRQLTDDILIELNKQLPQSTTVLNLSSNSLTSIGSLSNLKSLRVLDVSFNKLRHIPSKIFSRFPRLTSLHLQNNSLKTLPKTFRNLAHKDLDLSNNPFHCPCQLQWFRTRHPLCQSNEPFDVKDLCSRKSILAIQPHRSQIVYENDQLILNCSSTTRSYWSLNKSFYPSTITSSLYSTIIIHHLQINHSGIWTCHTIDDSRSISVTVLNTASEYFCPPIQISTSKGDFSWPRTKINRTSEQACPYASAAWFRNSNQYARAWYTCSSIGQWIDLDVSQCAFRSNISRIVDHLVLNERHSLLQLVKYLSKINRDHLTFDDVIYLIDFIDEQHKKYLNQDRIMLIYHLTDLILQIKQDFSRLDQYQTVMTRLRLIIERLLDLTKQSWLYVGKELTAITIRSPLVSTFCFIPNRSLLTIICDDNNRQQRSHLATIQFPSYSSTVNDQSLYRMIFYRQSTLFSSKESRKKTNDNNNHPVIYMRSVSRSYLSRVKLSFYDQANDASIGVWSANQTVWQTKQSICKIDKQNIDSISADCVLIANHSLSITYFPHQYFFFDTKYPQLVIYVSSIIGSICFFISILFHLCFDHRIYRMPKRLLHCLINYWLSLGLLLPLFAYGMQQHQYSFPCQFIATSVHYLCITTILWLTLLTYSIWSKLYTTVKEKSHRRKSSTIILNYNQDGLLTVKTKSEPIVQFYLLAYGIAFIICGIQVVLSREQHITNNICFLNYFDSILILIIPLIIFIFLLLIFLFTSRYYIKQITDAKIHLPSELSQTDRRSETVISLKSNKIGPILISSNENNEPIISSMNYHYFDKEDLDPVQVDRQYESINQLLSILFQLILLIFLFLSSLALHLQPLHPLKIRFEHIIYSHFYGFIVLFLAFYVLSFYVLSRWNVFIRYYFTAKNDKHLSNQSCVELPSSSIYSMANREYDMPSFADQFSIMPPSHSHYSSMTHVCEVSQGTALNDGQIYESERLANIVSDYNACHRCVPKMNETSSLKSIPKARLPFSSLDTISPRATNMRHSRHNLLYKHSSKRSINIPIQSSSNSTEHPPLSSRLITSSQTLTQPRTFPSQAIIRPLAITRFPSRSTTTKLSNCTDAISPVDHVNTSTQPKLDAGTSDHRNSLPSSTEQQIVNVSLDRTETVIEEKLSTKNERLYDSEQVLYIDDDDDERSVSLKSSPCDSTTSSSTLSTRQDYSQVLSSSISSTFDDFHHLVFHTKQKKLHESCV